MPATIRPYPPTGAPVVNPDRTATIGWIQYWDKLLGWAESILPINLADPTQVTGRLPYANQPELNPSTLVGRGSAAGVGNEQEIALGPGLIMTGTTLDATGAGVSTLVLLTADPGAPADDTWWAVREGASPNMIVSIKARIAGVTVTIASVTN